MCGRKGIRLHRPSDLGATIDIRPGSASARGGRFTRGTHGSAARTVCEAHDAAPMRGAADKRGHGVGGPIGQWHGLSTGVVRHGACADGRGPLVGDRDRDKRGDRRGGLSGGPWMSGSPSSSGRTCMGTGRIPNGSPAELQTVPRHDEGHIRLA